MITENRYIGCFIALAVADAYGAVYEGGFVERMLWAVIGKTRSGKVRYTDDTQMSIDLANSFLKNKSINQDDLAQTFADSYRWSRGYGASAASLLKKVKKGVDWRELNRKKFRDGSHGNGAAMRAPIVALCYPNNLKTMQEMTHKTAEITHANELAIEGAKLVATTTYGALNSWESSRILSELNKVALLDVYKEKLAFCSVEISDKNIAKLSLIKQKLGNTIEASNSSVTSIYFALKYRESSLNVMLEQIYNLGGDTDTIGAMAGAIWGAFNGYDKIDEKRVKRLESHEKIIELSRSLYNFHK